MLALVSMPTYDPNLMVGRERSINCNKMHYDEINKPLFDRGLQGEYPPGSPFKVITALTALQESAVTTTTTIKCFGGYRLVCAGAVFDHKNGLI